MVEVDIRYADELRGDARKWIEAVREQQKRKRPRAFVVPPPPMPEGYISNKDLPEGLLRIAWVTDVAFDGNHHVPTPREIHLGQTPYAVFVLYGRDFSTFDAATLTRLVVAGHDAAVRVQLGGARGFGGIEMQLHARTREGNQFERHPDSAGIAEVRSWRWPLCPFQVPAARPAKAGG